MTCFSLIATQTFGNEKKKCTLLIGCDMLNLNTANTKVLKQHNVVVQLAIGCYNEQALKKLLKEKQINLEPLCRHHASGRICNPVGRGTSERNHFWQHYLQSTLRRRRTPSTHMTKWVLRKHADSSPAMAQRPAMAAAVMVIVSSQSNALPQGRRATTAIG